jgi:hypothetical protein
LAAAEPETLVGGLKRRLDRLVGHDDRSVKVLVTELKDLLVAYAKQETLGPLKGLVRWVLWGIIGAIFLALGTVLLTLAVVRLLQAETGTHLTGNLSWVPYIGGLIFALAVIGTAASRIGKGVR